LFVRFPHVRLEGTFDPSEGGRVIVTVYEPGGGMDSKFVESLLATGWQKK